MSKESLRPTSQYVLRRQQKHTVVMTAPCHRWGVRNEAPLPFLLDDAKAASGLSSSPELVLRPIPLADTSHWVSAACMFLLAAFSG